MDRDQRKGMVRAFQMAFETWAQRSAHMDPRQPGMCYSDDGEYFASLLDELAAGRPWNEIGLSGNPGPPERH